MRAPRPPRLAERLLEWALPPTERAAAMIGDLHEEFAARVRRGERAVSVWYWREAIGVAMRYVRQGRGYYAGGVGRGSTASGTRTWEGQVSGMWMNVRYAVRRLVRAPGFTAVAVLSLALGIGANTAIFSLVNAVIIREQPFEDPETLVDVYGASDGFSHGTLSYPDYRDLMEGSRDVFSEIGGVQFAFAQVDVEGGVELLPAEAVTGNYFGMLGVGSRLGRLIGEEDHVAPGAHPVVALSHGYWERRFASDPGVVGSELRLAGRAYTVIGVAPEEFRGSLRGLEPEVYVPIMMYDDVMGSDRSVLERRGNHSFFAKARLAPGATLVEAEAVAERMTTTLRAQYPEDWRQDAAFVLVPTADVIMNPMIDRFIVPAAGTIMGVVGLVLLIACANLASFLLARAADRRKEIAVRLAMGARRRTLVGQLLTETVLLSALGGLAGLGLASWALRWLAGADLPLPLPITLDLTLDNSVLLFGIAVSAGAGVLFGLAPALQSTNPDVAPTLRDETAGGGRSRSAALRNALVIGQVAVSVVLLVGAGLFLRSLDASRDIDPGFGHAPSGVLELALPGSRYGEEEGRIFLEGLGERIAALPDVGTVGFIDNLHLNQLNTQSIRVEVDGVDPPVGQDYFSVDVARVDDGFLAAAGIAIVDGRGFDRSDVVDGEPVALVNGEFVRRFFPDGAAVGRTVRLDDEATRIVGVTADHKIRQLGEAPRPFVYQTQRQVYTRFATFVATTDGDADALALRMMAEARTLDPEVLVSKAETMERHLATLLLGRRMGALVVGGFALLALVLAAIGLYGVVSYAVSRRAREVGIRLSLGADPGSVVRMLTTSGMRLVAAGGAVGLLVSAGLAQLLARLLYGVPPLDPVTFIGVPLVLGAVALAASWIPARRVTRIDPVGSLRAE